MQSFAVRAAIHIAAIFGIYLSLAMLIPAFADLYYGNSDWRVFALSAFFTGGLSLAVALATQGRPPVVSSRFAFLLVNLLWFTTAAAGTIPFLASPMNMELSDAVFESVSAVTTTGSTVLVGLDAMAPGILLWRSILQWMGGLGVIALGLFILPFLNVGGVSYFKIESTDIEDRPFERLSTFTISLMVIYCLLTLACGIAYAAAGMDGFDALNHALTTISTAGFSTHDDSFGHFQGNLAILWVSIVFMFIGGLPFSILILLTVRGRLDALRDPQIRAFAGYTASFAILMTIYLRLTSDVPFFEALTHATFNFVSLVTTTGFSTHDYAAWGPFAVALAFIATFPGGCSGSTTGGIKAYRFIILFELMANGLRKLVYPNSVQPVRYGDRPVDEDMQRAVVLFIASFFVLWGLSILLLASTGLDLITAMTGSLTALTNVGPGLGDFIGPKGSFADVPDFAKWVLSLAMLFGRLEILAVLVIFTPVFWRR
ncbi:TrkH family potassium uptake protein [Aquibium sp. LZ166]|uniref:Trk system potassium uptake protein n=1 Tax=Aquibium pacificus TaxID=3153579 RepID=A0ABV3SQL4_9HYPH